MPRHSFTVHIDSPDAASAEQVHDEASRMLVDLSNALPDGQSLSVTGISASERDQKIRDMADDEQEGEA